MSPRPTCRLMRARQCETTARDDRRRRHVVSGDENRREDHSGRADTASDRGGGASGPTAPRANSATASTAKVGTRSGLPRATTAGGSGTGSCLFSTDARPTRNARASPWSPPAGRLCSCFAPWARSCSAAARTRRRRRAPARSYRDSGECDDRSDAAPVVSYSGILFPERAVFLFFGVPCAPLWFLTILLSHRALVGLVDAACVTRASRAAAGASSHARRGGRRSAGTAPRVDPRTKSAPRSAASTRGLCAGWSPSRSSRRPCFCSWCASRWGTRNPARRSTRAPPSSSSCSACTTRSSACAARFLAVPGVANDDVQTETRRTSRRRRLIPYPRARGHPLRFPERAEVQSETCCSRCSARWCRWRRFGRR